MEDKTTMESRTATGDPSDPEKNDSYVRLFGWKISVRGILALTITLTICIMGIRAMDVKEPLYSLAIAVVSFYMGQNSKTTTKNV
jgi:hypothetical protein